MNRGGPLGEDRRDFQAIDDLAVAFIDFALHLVERQPLGGHDADRRQRDRAFGRDLDPLALPAGEEAAIDGGPQVFEAGLRLDARDVDVGDLVDTFCTAR